MQLNEQQQIAVDHKDGPAVVLSVPGSGKTAMLVCRTGSLIERGVPANKILCITFTNKASEEMRERISRHLHTDNIGVHVSTFHSLCSVILRFFGKNIGYTNKYSILDDSDQADLIAQTGRKMNLKIDKAQARHIAYRVNDMREKLLGKEYLNECFYKKEEEEYPQIAMKYLENCRASNCIDFTGLQSETLRLFNEHPESLKKVQDKFGYIMIDETQDTSVIQFDIIEKIGHQHNNILITGDISQSIYMFRNARYQNITDFINKHENCNVMYLSKNYRSTPEIIKVADTLINHNSSHMSQVFETDNKSGKQVQCICCNDQDVEADIIAEKIEKLVYNEGWDLSDFAVLYRANAMSRAIEQALNTRGIKCRTVGGFSFYDRAEIKDCIAMLRFIVNPIDGIAFERIMKTYKGMGPQKIGQIENYAEENSVTIIEACKNAASYMKNAQAIESASEIASVHDFDVSEFHAGECLNQIVYGINYQEHLKKKHKDDWQDRWENVLEMINAAANFGEKEPDVSKYVQNLSLMTSDEKSDDSEDAVNLMTCHGAKGLEFANVFIIGCEQGIIPHSRSLGEDKSAGTDENLQEERRIFYVSITRAMKFLHLSYCGYRKQFGKNGGFNYNSCEPSQFLYEIGMVDE